MNAYLKQRSEAARWIYDRQPKAAWWNWPVLTAHNPDPERLDLPDTVAWNIFVDLAQPRAQARWRAIMRPPGFFAVWILRPLRALFVSVWRFFLFLGTAIISALIGAHFGADC